MKMKSKLLAVFSMLAMLLGLMPGAAHAEALPARVVVPVMGTLPTIVNMTVKDGSGGQYDPHLSGDWISYTEGATGSVRFQNLDLGFASDRIIPNSDSYDFSSDISSSMIAFTRYLGNSRSTIYVTQIDPFGNPDTVHEVSPIVDTLPLRTQPAIGGDTIAYEDLTYFGSTTAQPEISLSSATNPDAPAYRLTNDDQDDGIPEVSPDGNAVVWVKCEPTKASNRECHTWRAERTNGVWGAPEQVTGAGTIQTTPVTNGPVTVYVTDALGGVNIAWSVKDESGAYVESVLDLPGVEQVEPRISGNFIIFMGRTPTWDDIWLYDLATNRIYQLTNNSDYEFLMDVSTGPGGLVRVAWDQMNYPSDQNVYAMSFLLDTTAPVITPDIQGTLGQNGWYTSDVNLTWTVTDAQSPVDSTSGCDPVSITSDQAATEYTCSAESDGGASSATASIQRDTAKPATTVTGVAEGASYELGSVPQAGCASTDNLSGVAAEATLALTGGDAQGVGSITATCSGAVDAAGNAADPAVVHFTVTNPGPVTYNFTGFFQPVDNPGEGPSYVYNSVKAGSAIPVKFSLAGDQGLDIFETGYPTSRPASCTGAALTDPIEETVTAGNSSLSYNAASDTYTYVWKTDKSWVGTCRALNVKLDDGTQHLAYFRFK